MNLSDSFNENLGEALRVDGHEFADGDLKSSTIADTENHVLLG